jgi:hypothetical protein
MDGQTLKKPLIGYWKKKELLTELSEDNKTYPYGSLTGFFPCKVKLACAEEGSENLKTE